MGGAQKTKTRETNVTTPGERGETALKGSLFAGDRRVGFNGNRGRPQSARRGVFAGGYIGGALSAGAKLLVTMSKKMRSVAEGRKAILEATECSFFGEG